MTQTASRAEHWLRRRVRVRSGNVGPKVVLAEGVVVGYAPAPTIMVRDAQGRDTHWQTTLPIETLEEAVSDQELLDVIQAGDQAWMREVDAVALDTILNEAGIEYPLGLRGVRDLVNQRDGYLEAAQEEAAKRDKLREELTELRALKARLTALLHKYAGALPVELAQVLDVDAGVL